MFASLIKKSGASLIVQLKPQVVELGSLVRCLTTTAATGQEDKIHLRGLVFYGYHGALAEEKVLGQNFVVDATLITDLKKAGKTDNLDDTINYAEVYTDIKHILEGPPSNLLEHVAERIASTVLTKHAAVTSVSVGIRKPHVAVGGVLDSLGIEITRTRTRQRE